MAITVASRNTTSAAQRKPSTATGPAVELHPEIEAAMTATSVSSATPIAPTATRRWCASLSGRHAAYSNNIMAPAQSNSSGEMARDNSIGRERSSRVVDAACADTEPITSASSQHHRRPLPLGIAVDVFDQLARRCCHAIEHRFRVDTHPENPGQDRHEQADFPPVEVPQRRVSR